MARPRTNIPSKTFGFRLYGAEIEAFKSFMERCKVEALKAGATATEAGVARSLVTRGLSSEGLLPSPPATTSGQS